jgi:hypothetical protein
MKEFRPSQKQYLFKHSRNHAIVDFILCGTALLLRYYELAIAFAVLPFVEFFLLWIESTWADENLSIVVSDKFVVGPSQPKFRWKLMKWNRIKIPLDEISIEKSRINMKKRTLAKEFFSPENSITSLDGKRIFIDISFGENQVSQIAECLALK